MLELFRICMSQNCNWNFLHPNAKSITNEQPKKWLIKSAREIFFCLSFCLPKIKKLQKVFSLSRTSLFTNVDGSIKNVEQKLKLGEKFKSRCLCWNFWNKKKENMNFCLTRNNLTDEDHTSKFQTLYCHGGNQGTNHFVSFCGQLNDGLNGCCLVVEKFLVWRILIVFCLDKGWLFHDKNLRHQSMTSCARISLIIQSLQFHIEPNNVEIKTLKADIKTSDF